MDKVYTLADAKKHLNGMNGHSLTPGKGRPQDRPPSVDVGKFMDLISTPGMKEFARSIINSVNESRKGDIESSQLKVEMVAYEKLLKVLAVDRMYKMEAK